jgi:hypothetical protein
MMMSDDMIGNLVSKMRDCLIERQEHFVMKRSGKRLTVETVMEQLFSVSCMWYQMV